MTENTKYYHRRKENRLCSMCGEKMPDDDTRVKCEKCREYANKQTRMRYMARKAAGLCVRCGAKIDRELSAINCTACYVRDKQKHIKYAERNRQK